MVRRVNTTGANDIKARLGWVSSLDNDVSQPPRAQPLDTCITIVLPLIFQYANRIRQRASLSFFADRYLYDH
jgi:hypothetical protein